MYRKGYKDKRKGSPKPYRRRKNEIEKEKRYSSSNFKLLTYGPKREKLPAWERDTRSRSKSPGRRNRSQSPGRRDRSKSPKRIRSKSPKRNRSKSPKRNRSKSPKRNRSKSPKRNRSKSPKRESIEIEPEDEEEVNKAFHVLSVDLNIPYNTKEHHTDEFECTQSKQPELVVRRGQPFVLGITFDREYDKDQIDLEFGFTTGRHPKPPKGTAVEFDMDENKNGVGDHRDWYAKMTEKSGNSIKAEITPPSDCIIGEWNFSILTSSKLKPGDKAIIMKYVSNEDITILLNPWCEHDDVYLATTKLLDEYVLNDTGAVFQGNYKQINAKVWNFAQFEEDVLEISLHLIRKHFHNQIDSQLGDPIKLSRAITEIVNSNDGGVLEGNWSGDYKDGTSPTLWSSSKNILKQYRKKFEAVKYGQCWVFSAVTTTICRAIGLPARSVTNFSSAHDTDGSTTIDEEYEPEDMSRKKGSDSIWNFHVWNEVWMCRNDLGRGFDGWQVIDSTPQELSNGVFRCGPAPVTAIKRGEIAKMQYDLPFVFAEVNADVVKWLRQSPTKWKILKVVPDKVGKKISTKVPDGKPYTENTSIFSFFIDNKEDQRLDITNEYKYPEGTLEERLAVKNAASAATKKRQVETVEHDDVLMEIIDKDGILIGSKFDIEVKITNQSLDHKPRTITALDIFVQPVSYTGETGDKIAEKRFKKDVRLKYKEEETFTLTVTPDEYLDNLWEHYMMLITATSHVKETDKIHIENEDYRLRRPDITVKVPKTAKLGEPFEITMNLKNPLPKAMTGCVVSVEGNKVTDVEEKINDIPANGTWNHSMKITANRKGRIMLNVMLDCNELKDIAGNDHVQIE